MHELLLPIDINSKKRTVDKVLLLQKWINQKNVTCTIKLVICKNQIHRLPPL
jgi:hypothetical protein